MHMHVPIVYLILSHHRNKRNWKLIGLAELKDGNTSTAGDEWKQSVGMTSSQISLFAHFLIQSACTNVAGEVQTCNNKPSIHIIYQILVLVGISAQEDVLNSASWGY